MIELVRSKLDELVYSSQDSNDELYKLIEISKLVIEDKSNECSPPYTECIEAIRELSNFEKTEIDQKTFVKIKSEVLNIYDKLLVFIREVDNVPSINILMHGQTSNDFNNDLRYEFLVVEQDNMDYFKKKVSQIPGQLHEVLSHHYWIFESAGNITFGYNEGSDLPEYIRKQTREAFEKIAKKYKQNI